MFAPVRKDLPRPFALMDHERQSGRLDDFERLRQPVYPGCAHRETEGAGSVFGRTAALLQYRRKLGPEGIVLRLEIRHDVKEVFVELERVVSRHSERADSPEQALHFRT